MMPTATTERVLLEELAVELGGPLEQAEHWVRVVKGKVESDWRGRAVTSPEAARSALSAHREHAAKMAQLASDYDAYLRNRGAELMRIGEERFQEEVLVQFNSESRALATATDTFYTSVPMTPSPIARHVAQEACNQARAEYERKHPLATFEDFCKKASKR